MVLGEIVPALQVIAKQLVPTSKPALDVLIIFHYAPNDVLIVFFIILSPLHISDPPRRPPLSYP
ncbi:hypothetical protein G3385_13235, partial [Enterococcus faecium]|nr:hypothetical protein [Enterococcus faecium]